MRDLSDAELMARVRVGDRAAFEEVYRRHSGRVFAYLWRMMGDEAIAADLRQDTFFRLWQARAEWRGGGSVAGYLVRTARNLALNVVRRQRVRDHTHAVELDTAATSPAPDQVIAGEQLADRVNAAVQALPERMREVFTLKRDASLSYLEIAELLGISPKTVEAHMAKALKVLRSSLADLRDRDSRQ